MSGLYGVFGLPTTFSDPPCGPVRLPGPDSTFKMLLSSEIFCGDDNKNSAVWAG